MTMRARHFGLAATAGFAFSLAGMLLPADSAALPSAPPVLPKSAIVKPGLSELKQDLATQALGGDAQLADAVASKLFLDQFISPESVQITVKDGKVQLDGNVADLREAELVKRMAEGVRGVKRVDSRLRFRISGASDAKIVESAQTLLSSDPATDTLGITARASHGTLELYGRVTLRAEAGLAEWVAEGVPGVREVKNHIRVHALDTGRTDREIAQALRARLRADAWLGEDSIQSAVHGGRVRLAGQVSSAAEQTRAIAIAWLPGVASVDSSGLKINALARDHVAPAILRAEAGDSDDKLRADILEAFRFDARLNGLSPQVTVKYRVATLRGTVEDLAEKLSAEDDTWNIGGVTGLVEELEVKPPSQNASDADLALAVTSALRAGLPAETWGRLVSSVKKGSVTIAGNVSEAYERWQARDIVSRIRGVVGIDNRVRVMPVIEGTKQAGLTDEQMRDRALLVLKWDPLLSPDDQIQLEVSGGVARLTGRVESSVRALQAARDAFDAGVSSVKSDLVVGPRSAGVILIEKKKAGIVTTGGPEVTTYASPPTDAYPSFRQPQS